MGMRVHFLHLPLLDEGEKGSFHLFMCDVWWYFKQPGWLGRGDKAAQGLDVKVEFKIYFSALPCWDDDDGPPSHAGGMSGGTSSSLLGWEEVKMLPEGWTSRLSSRFWRICRFTISLAE